ENTFFTLGPGDVIEVELLGSPNSRAVLRIGPDGKIYYQMLPGLDVWGLTLAETKQLLQKQLSEYVTGVQVSVALRRVTSKSVWLLGRVNAPGIYPMAGPMTLLEAVAMAGGPAQIGVDGGMEDQADLRHSFVQREGKYVPVDFQKLFVEGDMSQNIYLQPDDFIYMPSSLFHEVFVLGAVRSPSSLPYSDHLTLVKAIASTAGALPGAHLTQVAIVRGSLAEPKVAVVDYKAIVGGKATDIKLEPHDIVYVPTQPYAGLKSYAMSILSVFVSTIAANEGANAVQEDSGTVGISIAPVTPTSSSTSDTTTTTSP
ncbi:MAG TPA: SLBB domain-containing protein, partial [Verrucomicrobiota bacterium]|nr:SLBB domain-containing protein [Verrucomicrobiota bacterium]